MNYFRGEAQYVFNLLAAADILVTGISTLYDVVRLYVKYNIS